jgi:hypothetical protein
MLTFETTEHVRKELRQQSGTIRGDLKLPETRLAPGFDEQGLGYIGHIRFEVRLRGTAFLKDCLRAALVLTGLPIALV